MMDGQSFSVMSWLCWLTSESCVRAIVQVKARQSRKEHGGTLIEPPTVATGVGNSEIAESRPSPGNGRFAFVRIWDRRGDTRGRPWPFRRFQDRWRECGQHQRGQSRHSQETALTNRNGTFRFLSKSEESGVHDRTPLELMHFRARPTFVFGRGVYFLMSSFLALYQRYLNAAPGSSLLPPRGRLSSSRSSVNAAAALNQTCAKQTKITSSHTKQCECNGEPRAACRQLSELSGRDAPTLPLSACLGGKPVAFCFCFSYS